MVDFRKSKSFGRQLPRGDRVALHLAGEFWVAVGCEGSGATIARIHIMTGIIRVVTLTNTKTTYNNNSRE